MEVHNGNHSINHGRRPRRTVLAQEPQAASETISVFDRGWENHDPAYGRADFADGSHEKYLYRDQSGLQKTGVGTAAGDSGRKHPLRTGCAKHSPLYRLGRGSY